MDRLDIAVPNFWTLPGDYNTNDKHKGPLVAERTSRILGVDPTISSQLYVALSGAQNWQHAWLQRELAEGRMAPEKVPLYHSHMLKTRNKHPDLIAIVPSDRDKADIEELYYQIFDEGGNVFGPIRGIFSYFEETQGRYEFIRGSAEIPLANTIFMITSLIPPVWQEPFPVPVGIRGEQLLNPHRLEDVKKVITDRQQLKYLPHYVTDQIPVIEVYENLAEGMAALRQELGLNQ